MLEFFTDHLYTNTFYNLFNTKKSIFFTVSLFGFVSDQCVACLIIYHNENYAIFSLYIYGTFYTEFKIPFIGTKSGFPLQAVLDLSA